MVRDERIVEILWQNRERPSSEIAFKLVHEACVAGGRDNVTALVVRVMPGSEKPVSPAG